MNKLLVLGADDLEKFTRILGISKRYVTALDTGTIELYTPCKTMLYSDMVLTAVSVVLDLYTVTSVVS